MKFRSTRITSETTNSSLLYRECPTLSAMCNLIYSLSKIRSVRPTFWMSIPARNMSAQNWSSRFPIQTNRSECSNSVHQSYLISHCEAAPHCSSLQVKMILGEQLAYNVPDQHIYTVCYIEFQHTTLDHIPGDAPCSLVLKSACL